MSKARVSLKPLNPIIQRRNFSSTSTFSAPPPPSPAPPPLTPSLLKQCKTQLQAAQIHQQTIVQNHHSHLFTTHLLSTYTALNCPSLSLSLLRRLSPFPSAISFWNSLIRLSLRHGLLLKSLSLFSLMRRLGWSPDHFTFPFVFKASGELPSFRFGSSVHGAVWVTGFGSNVFVCNAIVTMYGRCGRLDLASQVFGEMRDTGVVDLVSWNSISAAYGQQGCSRNALVIFHMMCESEDFSVRPDAVSLVNVLPACAAEGSWLRGKEVHGFAVRSGLFEDVFVGNALVDMYAKCERMKEAKKVFHWMIEKDVVSWNAMVTGYCQIAEFEEAFDLFETMRDEKVELDVVSWSAVIAGYAQRGLGHEALNVFRQMQVDGCKPNEVTLVSLLSGCASVGALCQGKETHCYAIKCVLGVDGVDGPTVINALIDMYAKCKDTIKARALFDYVPLENRNVVTWTAMVGGYAQHGEANEALLLFSQMLKKHRPIRPNAFTISCALMACARLATLRVGQQVHAYILRNQYDSEQNFVVNCLVDMYSKSGDIDAARVVFDNMRERNDVSWTSLMTGYGMHGRGEEALEVFDGMKKAGFMPDSITFLVAVYACSHAGMVDEGVKYFNSMEKEFGVVPGAEHYACMVDLLGRAGRLDEAIELIKRMPMEPRPIVWVALLSGCRKHANVDLGEYAAQKLLESESENDGSYTLLSNLYANARRWKDVVRVRTLMKNTGIRKRPGCSWVQGKKGTAAFYVGDKTHPLSQEIYEKLGDLIQQIKVLGYVPETSFVLHDVDDEEKGDLLFEHSEKLALAYGILTTSPGASIRITKNLRICGDCHSAITYISRIVEHEIILRDSSRFHHFKSGVCSCRGFW